MGVGLFPVLETEDSLHIWNTDGKEFVSLSYGILQEIADKYKLKPLKDYIYDGDDYLDENDNSLQNNQSFKPDYFEIEDGIKVIENLIFALKNETDLKSYNKSTLNISSQRIELAIEELNYLQNYLQKATRFSKKFYLCLW